MEKCYKCNGKADTYVWVSDTMSEQETLHKIAICNKCKRKFEDIIERKGYTKAARWLLFNIKP